jgi:hypothetical protein
MKIRKEVEPAFRFARKRLAKNLGWIKQKAVDGGGLGEQELRILFINTYLLGAKDLLVKLQSEGVLKRGLSYINAVSKLKIDKVQKLPRNILQTAGCCRH